MEPYVLWFKDKTWYLKAFCLEKKAFRIFRLSRIRNVLCLNENYIPKKIDSHTLEYTQPFPITKIIMRIEASQKYRVYDDFQDNDIIENQDGSYTVTMKFVEDEWVYGYILSFGENATVLEPERVKDIIKKRLEENLKKYL